ncbi:MAG: chorismate mutase [Alphaproteobacteria bacterium]|nr:chorismate mutase [Alphaproteobacteria bacterium]HRI76023.1 chorismate mutase [Alphaproteobacteria bacterium]
MKKSTLPAANNHNKPQDKAALARSVLKQHRRKIDKIDAQLLKLLGDRFDVVRDVAKVKIKHDIPAFLGGRVNEVRNNAVKLGLIYGIDPDFVRTLYTMLIYQSCAEEEVLKHQALLAKAGAGDKPAAKKSKKAAKKAAKKAGRK